MGIQPGCDFLGIKVFFRDTKDLSDFFGYKSFFWDTKVFFRIQKKFLTFSEVKGVSSIV